MESLAIQSILKKPDEEPDLVTNQKLVTDRGRNVVGKGGGRRGRAQVGGGGGVRGVVRGGGGKGGTGVCKYLEKWGEGGLGRGGPEYANTPRNGGQGGWEGEDRSMQIPRGREYVNTTWELVMCRYSWWGCISIGWGGGYAV